MDDGKIFRKVAIERLSSPENLDQVMYVVPFKNWVVLIGLIVIVASAVAWACIGEIVRLVDGKGALLSNGSSAPETVIAVLNANDIGDVKPGMEAHITVDSADGPALIGKVTSVSTIDEMIPALDGISISEESLTGWNKSSGAVVALIRLDAGEIEDAAKILATVEPQMIGNSTGWVCDVQITIESYPPVRLILPE